MLFVELVTLKSNPLEDLCRNWEKKKGDEKTRWPQLTKQIIFLTHTKTLIVLFSFGEIGTLVCRQNINNEMVWQIIHGGYIITIFKNIPTKKHYTSLKILILFHPFYTWLCTNIIFLLKLIQLKLLIPTLPEIGNYYLRSPFWSLY